ncbi:MAG: hypothetical protein MJ052_03605 [Sphaerochaetaceae bacterium]|nr:hypothetical protein [Sphaerochaetaceae bacterium]
MVRKKVLKAVVFTLILLAFLCGCTNDVNRHVFKAVVARVSDSTGIHDFMSLQLGVDYVINRNKTAAAPAARNSRDVPENEIARENTVFLLRNIDTDFHAGPVTVDDYNDEICIDYNGFEYDYSQNSGYFLRILDGSKVKIRNGKTVIFEDNPSLQAALIVNTGNVVLENHIIDDRRKKGTVDEDNVTLPYAVEVKENGHLEINGTGDDEVLIMGDVFKVASGGKLVINSGKIRIMDFIPNDLTADFTITGGTIVHPHKVDEVITLAAQGHTGVFKEEFVHVVGDFDYRPHEGTTDTVNLVCRRAVNCRYVDKKATIRPKPGFERVQATGQPLHVCEIVYDDKWEGIRPAIRYIDEKGVTGSCVDADVAEVSAVFLNPDGIGTPVTIRTTFQIYGPVITGNGDWDAKLPIELEEANKIKPQGVLGFAETAGNYKWTAANEFVKADDGDIHCEAGDVVFSHTNGYESTILSWKWIIDKYERETIETGTGSEVTKINIYHTEPYEEGIRDGGKNIVCQPRGYGGVGNVKLIIPVVQGTVEPRYQSKTVFFEQTNTVAISRLEWTIKQTKLSTGETVTKTVEKDVAGLDGKLTITDADMFGSGGVSRYFSDGISVKCYFWNGNSYTKFEKNGVEWY